jgi:alpha-tubulin suppressor-like RCC1 family protein
MKINPTMLIMIHLILTPFFSVAAQPTGEVIGWGSDLAGQATGVPSIKYFTNKIEFNSQFKSEIPIATGIVKVTGQTLNNVVAIAAGNSHGLALTSDGVVLGWGWNVYGQATGIATTSGLQVSNGPVETSGRVLNKVNAIAAGRTHSIALKNDGTIVTWGALNTGRKINFASGLNNVIAVAAGWDGSLVLKKDGIIIGWDMPVPQGISNIAAVAVSKSWYGKNLALKSDGTVIEWGNRSPTMINTLTALSNVVAIAAGANHSLALKRDGTVFSWGSAAGNLVAVNGVVLTNVVAISAGDEFSLALKNDGTVISWGNMNYHPAIVPSGLSNIVAIAAGDNFCLAITTNKAVADGFRTR